MGHCLHRTVYTVFFYGDHTFINNTAAVGGAIYVRFSINFTTTGRFRMENNTAFIGGAVYIANATYHGEGVYLYDSNWGDLDVFSRGGSAFLGNCEVNFVGNMTFHNSSAHTGAFMLFRSAAVFSGEIMFTANRGGLAAGLYVDESSARFFGNLHFEKNVATVLPSLQIYLSRIELNGNLTFINNFFNDALQAVNSNGTLIGNILVRNNTGFIGGGFRFIQSDFLLQGLVNFENNHAQTFGGGLDAYNSTIRLTGTVNLSNNSSPRGGGMFL